MVVRIKKVCVFVQFFMVLSNTKIFENISEEDLVVLNFRYLYSV